MDLIATDESPSQISDTIKDLLFGKSAEKIEGLKSAVASSVFGEDEEEIEYVGDEEVSFDDEESEYNEEEEW